MIICISFETFHKNKCSLLKRVIKRKSAIKHIKDTAHSDSNTVCYICPLPTSSPLYPISLYHACQLLWPDCADFKGWIPLLTAIL